MPLISQIYFLEKNFTCFGQFPLPIIRRFFSLYTQQWYNFSTTYNIALCTVKKTPDDGQRNCPKHVEFYSKNEFDFQVTVHSDKVL